MPMARCGRRGACRGERPGARIVDAPLPFPRPTPEAMVAAVAAAITPRTRLAVLDHITSPSALVLPIEAMVAACRARGVPVLVDGAHGPGQVPLRSPRSGPTGMPAIATNG